MAKSSKKEERPNPFEKPEASSVAQLAYKRYSQGVEVLSRSYVFFNDISPLQYWAEGRKRFNVYLPPRRTSSKEWKTMYKSAMTRNKCLGIIAHIVSMMIEPSIQAQNEHQDEDVAASTFFKDMLEYTKEKEDFAIRLFWAVTTAVAEGTCILEENYGEKVRPAKEITGMDENRVITWKKAVPFVDYAGAYTNIIPNDELLIANPWQSGIQTQDWIIHRKRMTLDQAKQMYGNYPKFNEVRPGSSDGWSYSDAYFEVYDGVSYMNDNEVEVMRMWDKTTDEFHIIISGVQLTPDGNPNPRADKQYPFSVSGYEPIDKNFFWFKSLTDKLQAEQDVYDTVLRMFIDRQHLRNVPPLLTNNPSLVNEDIVVPGMVTYTGTTDDNKVTTIAGFDTGTDNGTIQLIQTMAQSASEGSLNPMQTGNTPTGGTPTATQALQMSRNAQVMLGLFGTLVGYLIRDWTKLRLQTILWELSTRTDLSKITMQDKVLNTGKVGKRTYVFESGLSKRPSETKNKISRTMKEIEDKNEGKLQIVAIDPDELTNLALYVKIDAQPRPKRTDELMKALALEKFQVYASRPDVFNLNAAAIQLAQVWGDDPDDVVRSVGEEGRSGQEAATQAMGQQPQKLPMTSSMVGAGNPAQALGAAPNVPTS